MDITLEMKYALIAKDTKKNDFGAVFLPFKSSLGRTAVRPNDDLAVRPNVDLALVTAYL